MYNDIHVLNVANAIFAANNASTFSRLPWCPGKESLRRQREDGVQNGRMVGFSHMRKDPVQIRAQKGRSELVAAAAAAQTWTLPPTLYYRRLPSYRGLRLFDLFVQQQQSFTTRSARARFVLSPSNVFPRRVRTL